MLVLNPLVLVSTPQHTHRILIAVYFGLIILLSSLAVLLALRASWPRTAASMTLGLWLIMALTLLMGAGTPGGVCALCVLICMC